MRILQINTADVAGGAEAVAWQLMRGYRRAGHLSWLAVGQKRSQDPDVLPVLHDQYRDLWSRWCLSVSNQLGQFIPKGQGGRRFSHLIGVGLGQPRRLWHVWQGQEDFDFPGTPQIKEMTTGEPDVIHCHNLHGSWLPSGGYFDLSVLPQWGQTLPVVLTLHDAWMLSGHCAHSFDCDRWKSGCGACPDLTIYPAVHRDATAFNWKRKQAIYANSRLYIATPSRWLMQKVQSSMLRPAAVETKVIPNGVDLSVFHPADKAAVRQSLGVPQDVPVLLFVAHGIRNNTWKDYAMLRRVIDRIVARAESRAIVFIALGEEAEEERIGNVTIQFIPYVRSRAKVARYFQAADIYLHASRADTFPHSILEALACGVPVVATSVGGIPEQVDDNRTGFLVPAGDAEAMADRVVRLLSTEARRAEMGAVAADRASRRFGLQQQVDAYLDWYQQILAQRRQDRTVAHAC